MKFGKQVLSFISVIVLLFANCSISAYASNNILCKDSSLFIFSKECPNEYIEYAKNNMQKYFGDFVFDSNEVSIGTPFTFSNYDSDIFYFPVIDNDKIAMLLRVFESDDGLTAVGSKFLCDELQQYSTLTTEENPLYLYMNGNEIIAEVSSSKKTLFEYPNDMNFENDELTGYSLYDDNNQNDYSVINVFDQKIDTIEVGIDTYASTSKYINLNLMEYQGTEPWCATYVASTIIRTIQADRSCWVRTIMNYYYSNPSGKSLTEVQIMNFAKNKYSLKVKQTVSSFGNQAIKEIDANRPVYYGMVSGNSRHAVVLRGYNVSSGIYSIWNPWYKYYETFKSGGTYCPAEDSSGKYNYKYQSAIYNWTK